MAERGAAGPEVARTVRALRRLDGAVHRGWFLPAVGVFPLGDYALPFLPNQMLLTALAVLHPRRWKALTLTFVLAAGLGALIVTALVQATGAWLVEAFPGDPGDPGSLTAALDPVRRYGVWALAVLSLLPWPPRAAVLACALAGLDPWAIAATVMVGRTVPVGGLAFIGARSPFLLRRWRRFDRLLTAVEADRDTVGR